MNKKTLKIWLFFTAILLSSAIFPLASQADTLPSIAINVDKKIVNPGETVSVVWSTLNAVSCNASGGWSGPQGTSGLVNITVTSPVSFILTCKNSSGYEMSATTAVATIGSGGLVTQSGIPYVTLSISQNAVPAGSPVTLIWSSSNASFCQAFGAWNGLKATSGSESITPTQTSSYSIDCTNGTYHALDTKNVAVLGTAQTFTSQPTVFINASPVSINKGGSSLLSWSSSGAVSCFASGGWSGNKNISGTEAVFPQNTSTYFLTCANSGGASALNSATVAVSSVQGTSVSTGNAVIQFQKLARNVILRQDSFASSIEAQGLDIIEFQILVRNAGNQAVVVAVRDQLPGELYYTAGTTKINDSLAPDGIASAGISLGALNPGEQKTVKFRTVVFFGVKPQTIQNQATVTADSQSKTGGATIVIKNRGKALPGYVSTGPGNLIPLILLLGFFGSLGAYFLLFKYRFAGKTLRSIYADARFVSAVRELKRKEKIPDTELS